jgi:ATP synthase protein I
MGHPLHFQKQPKTVEPLDTQPQTEPEFVPLTLEQAQAWRAQNPTPSPWRMVLFEAVLGVVCAGLAGWLTQRGNVAWSALYGALVVVVPSAVMAHGMNQGSQNPATAAAGFLKWEVIKIAVALTLLLLAVKVVPQIHWLALVVNMVVCTKVGWWVLFKQYSLPVKKS